MKLCEMIIVACCFVINTYMLKKKVVGNYDLTRKDLNSIIVSSIAVGICVLGVLILPLT